MADTHVAADAAGCRRAGCTITAYGRGLCFQHYLDWLAGDDPLELPDDTGPAPSQPWWLPPALPAPESTPAPRTAPVPRPLRREKVAAQIRADIESGRWQVLPTIIDLAAHYGAAPGTVLSALRNLEAEHVVAKPTRAWIIPGQPPRTGAQAAEQLAVEFRRRIDAGDWAEAIPGRDELRRMFRASSRTVTQATVRLRDEGVLVKRQCGGRPRWCVAADGDELPAELPGVQRVAGEIRRRVSTGEWIAGLPPRPSLMRLIRASQRTVGPALELLRQEGVLEKRLHGGRRRWCVAGSQEDPDVPTPAALRVANEIRQRIDAGEWTTAITPRDELAGLLHAGDRAVAAALTLLEADGVLEKRRHGAKIRWCVARR